MAQAWCVAPYRTTTGSRGLNNRRYCALNDVLPPQQPGEVPHWSETEVLGGYAVALMDTPSLAPVTGPGFYVFPEDMLLTGRLDDHLNPGRRREVRDVLEEMGYSRAEMASRLGDSDLGGPLATLYGVLSFAATRRVRLRYDAASDRPVPTGDIEIPNPLPVTLRAVFGDTGFKDRFNRPDEVPASGWGEVSFIFSPVFEVSSNQATSSNGGCYLQVAKYGPDSEAWVTVKTWGSTDFAEVFVRYKDVEGANIEDGYKMEVANATNTAFIQRIDNSIETTLGSSISYSPASGHKIGIEALGDQISGYNDTGGGWSSLGTRTDGTHTSSGRIGTSAISGIIIDDFGGGTVLPIFTVGNIALRDNGAAVGDIDLGGAAPPATTKKRRMLMGVGR
jgi:hypothetical protein